jgi:hypothetical protein
VTSDSTPPTAAACIEAQALEQIADVVRRRHVGDRRAGPAADENVFITATTSHTSTATRARRQDTPPSVAASKRAEGRADRQQRDRRVNRQLALQETDADDETRTSRSVARHPNQQHVQERLEVDARRR